MPSLTLVIALWYNGSMTTPKTQSRALQLVIHDMNVAGKPTDDAIAEEWGLASARSVREVRESDEYKLVLGELQKRALSHVGEAALRIQTDAVSALTEVVPLLKESVVRMLTPPDDYVRKEEWRPRYTDLTAANGAVNTLVKLANLGGVSVGEARTTTEREQLLPTLQPAVSDSSVIKERYSLVVERMRQTDDPIEADYEILQDDV